jgi:type VI secretion system protein ImpG
MQDPLLDYYQKEITFLRRMGAEFARRYPKIASRLQLSENTCDDPHLERLIQASAFLLAQVQLKLDDDFPEITEPLSHLLYPYHLGPVPSMSIVRFRLDPAQGRITTGFNISPGVVLYSKPIQGTACRFRTCYPLTLWPIEISSAALELLDPANTSGGCPEGRLRIGLRCFNDTKLSELTYGSEDKEATSIDILRFYLNGDPALVYPLYEMIFNNVKKVELIARPDQTKTGQKTPDLTLSLPPSYLKPLGFDSEHNLLPGTSQVLNGYNLLTEYFAFPEKFLFFELGGLDEAARTGDFGADFEILIYLEKVKFPQLAVDRETFQLGCTPIINLFTKTAEPIHLAQQKHEYLVVAESYQKEPTEVYSVDAVTTKDTFLGQIRSLNPFYSIGQIKTNEKAKSNVFWYATRSPNQASSKAGSEVYISLVDRDFKPNVPQIESLTVHTTCTNGNLPSNLSINNSGGDFEVEGTGLLTLGSCLKQPTAISYPPIRDASQWAYLSHFSLNHLSLNWTDERTPLDAFQGILFLYDYLNPSAVQKQIEGIKGITSRRVTRRLHEQYGTGFARGIETTFELEEDYYFGHSAFLFATVLEHFLGSYVSPHSFIQLVVKIVQNGEILKRWLPRQGTQKLL